MKQLKSEDNFCGEITQQLDIEVLLQDADAFENVFVPSTDMDYNPMNLNEIIDFDELHSILDEGKDRLVVGNEGAGPSDSHDSTTLVAADHGELMHLKPKLKNEQQAIKKWTTRKKIQKGTPEAYEKKEKKELHKIKNREAAARAFEQKKAYAEWLELEVQKYRKKNTDLKRLLMHRLRHASKTTKKDELGTAVDVQAKPTVSKLNLQTTMQIVKINFSI